MDDVTLDAKLRTGKIIKDNKSFNLKLDKTSSAKKIYLVKL